MEYSDWDIRREARHWTQEEAERRIYQAPEKIEIDKVIRFGELEDWKAAIADLEKQRGE
jgi:hypothetical protein